jgi:hypothetical protein
LIKFLAFEFRTDETGRGDGVSYKLELAGQLLGLGVQPRLVLNVSDRYALRCGDSTAEIGGVGKLGPPLLGFTLLSWRNAEAD